MLTVKRVLPIVVAVSAIAAATVFPIAQSTDKARSKAPVTLPAGIVWETNNDDPPIGSPKALRGGALNVALGQYPLTFRLMGPNANDAFANWNRLSTMYLTLVRMHPVTNNWIPTMATHWSIQPDHRTIYFRLDRDARWSDGRPVTADDYVFTFEMMQSEFIVDPFYNEWVKTYLESVDKLDDYTIRIVGTRPSWRPLYDYAQFWPTPRQANVLDKDWVARSNNVFQVVQGPYVVSEVSRGESVTLTRVKDWWGDKKRYFQGMFNFDRIQLKMFPLERSLDYLRSGQIDMMGEPTARTWNEEYNFEAVQKGWIRRVRIFQDFPSGVNGLHMNLSAPIFKSKDFRKAMQHLFNFERLNRNLMFNEYYRQVSFFEGTEFASPNVKPYPFDPVAAGDYLAKAGYHRPARIHSVTLFDALRNVVRGLLFTRSDVDDVLVNDRGERASFVLQYGNKGLERHLTVMQQEYRRAGVDVRLQLLEPGTAFERGLERKYEMTLTGRTTDVYPDPRQYLHSSYLNSVNNNDIWGFGTKEVDDLIQIYEEDMNEDNRIKAMHRIDEIVHDEAFYIPFWVAPYSRMVYWDYIQWPEFYLPLRAGYDMTKSMVYWFDPAKKAALDEAMKTGQSLPVDPDIDKDYYGVRKRFE